MLIMEQHIFKFSFIKEGATEKVSKFIMPLDLIFNKNIFFHEQKSIFLNIAESLKH